MNEIGKIWGLDFRRQRAVLLVMIPLAVMLALIVFYGGLAQTPREILTLAIVVLLPIAGYLVSADVWARDFRERTVDFYLALPVADGKVFFARYLSSLAVFALFIWLPLLLIVDYGASEGGQPVIDVCRKAFHLSTPGWGRVPNPGLCGPGLALLLLIHAMQLNWTLGLRGDKGLQAGFLLTPLALLALWPATVWIYSPELYTVVITNRAAVSFLLIATVGFLLGGWWLWTRGVGRGGRAGWMLVKLWGGLIVLSVGAWVLFYAIEIPSYLVTLNRFEHTPGIDIVRGPQRVPEVIQKYRPGQKLKPEELAAADFSKSVEIPVAAYRQYKSKLLFFQVTLKKAIENSLTDRHYELAATLIKRFREMPDLRVPQLSSTCYMPGNDMPERSCINADPIMRSTFILYILKFPAESDALPFYRAMEQILAQKAVLPKIKIVLSDKPEHPFEEFYLAANLPGIETNGWKRIVEVLAWVCDWRQTPIRGAKLRRATMTMTHWIAVSEYFRQLATLPPEKLAIAFASQQKNPAFVLQRWDDPVFESIRDHYFLLPYCRIQQYAIERGAFPKSPQQMLEPGEPEIFRLYYCMGTVNKHQLHATLPQDYAQLRLHAQSQYSSHCLPLVNPDAKGSK